MNTIIESIDKHTEKTLILCGSMYQLFLAKILIKNKKKEDVYFILFINKSDTLFHKTAINVIKKMNIESNSCIYIKDKLDILTGCGDVKLLKFKRKIKEYLNVPIEECLFINFNWCNEYVHYPACRLFDCVSKAIFIEDSPFGYVDNGEGKAKRLIKRIYRLNFDFYKNKKLEAIYVQKPEAYKKGLQKYLTKFDLKSLLQKMSSDEKEQIANLFLCIKEKEQIQKLMNTEVGIVFTQCLSEDGYCSEDEKIKIYKKIVDFYQQYGVIVLKTHPRERTKYTFSGCTVLSGTFPSEIFALYNINFKFAIGLCTGAINSIEADKKMNLNENFYVDKRFNCISL